MIIQINFVDAHKEELKKFIIEANRCWARKKLYYKIIPFAKQFFIWGYVSGIYRLGSQKMIDRLYSDPSPAKPAVSDGRTSGIRSDSNEKRTAQDRGAIPDTGGGFTIISMGKIGDEDIKCDSCGAVITKSELEVRGSQKLCTDCAVVHDIDGENVEE